jgi:hypothetical protein
MSSTTFSTGCFACGGTGVRVVHKQGDLVSGFQNPYANTFYASTLYTSCECMIIRSQIIAGVPSELPDDWDEL